MNMVASRNIDGARSCRVLLLCACLASINFVNCYESISYSMVDGFRSPATCTTLENQTETITKRSSFVCPNDRPRDLLSTHIETSEKVAFTAEQLLSSLRDKSLSIIGDSIALQMFHSLQSDLACFESFYHNGNGVDTRYKHQNHQVWPGPNHYHAAMRKYGKYNASLLFCYDPTLYLNNLPARYQFCTHRALLHDVVVLGVGHWFKVWKVRPGYTYRSELDIAASTFRSSLQNITAFVHTVNPNAKFVWRLLPHTGDVDEMVYNASTREGKSAASKLHFDGSFWNDVSHEAAWVSMFNEIIVENAKLWNDSYLDWHTMSVLALNYYRSTPVNGKIINGHIDSQHFCSGGVARHTNILLQTLLQQLFGAV